ncbi:MAG: YegS/Rv2252/BmrU family lipid kinase [Candidatus Cloacimonetes bacterium]|nr:YegS/Rv2252/BmrU family lipid kinase [Candidatus Cloacimonadota bacterium]
MKSKIEHYSIIFNPTAGKGKAQKKLPIIKQFFSDNKLNYSLHITERIGHAINLSESLYKKPNSAVIAVGGDGTVNEVINGLMLSKSKNPSLSPVFGVIAAGRGNDFAFGAGVPEQLDKCLDLMITGVVKPLDIGLIKGEKYPDGRYFGNGIGVGFDTIVGLEAAKLKHIHGAAAYLYSAIKTIITYPEAPQVEMSLNEIPGTYTPILISIMNGRRMGGQFFMAPEAENNDGLLDLCMTKQGTRLKLLKTMLHYMKGTQSKLDNTEIARIANIKIEAIKGDMAVHADGETFCEKCKALEIDCIPKGLSIITEK